MRTNKRATGVIIRDNKILLLRRYQTYRGEYFTFPGGGVESDESIEDALIREMKEELSIDVIHFRKLYEFSYQKTFKPGDRNDHFFLITEYNGKPRWVVGNEGDKESLENQYHLEWYEIQELAKLELYPLMIREKLDELSTLTSKSM